MFSIRTANLDDVPAIAGIFRRASLSNAGDRENLLAHPEVLELDDTPIHEGRTRVAITRDTDQRIVGFATTRDLDANAIELDDLFTDPDWMRQGVARLLVDDVAAAARARHIDRVEVSANPHALRFYERVGFVEHGEVATLFGSAIRMHLDLDPGEIRRGPTEP
jgi:ribosomal protein S18 acetylase RimI-like enzyme